MLNRRLKGNRALSSEMARPFRRKGRVEEPVHANAVSEKDSDVDSFTLPFIPSHQGRENPVPSPSMERFWERRVQVKRENSQKWRNVTGRKSGEITKER
jgi:hypothetical protein